MKSRLVINDVRYYFLDIAKIITAFLVILGHLYTSDSVVRLHIYGFHMPLFFIISGIFHKYTGKIRWQYYTKTIIWPLLVFVVLLITTNIFFQGSDLKTQLRVFFIDIPKGKVNTILWFLFALFWCKVFLDCFLSFRSFILPFFIWSILLFVPVIILKIRLPFAISQGMMALPFYTIGYLGKGVVLTREESFKWIIPFILCMALTLLITRLQGRVSMLGVNFGNIASYVYHGNLSQASIMTRSLFRISNILLFYINGVIGSLMIISFSLLPWPKSKFVTSVAKSLITVLGTQSVFYGILIKHIGYNNSFFISLVATFCIYTLCYLSHKILRPIYYVVK